MSEDVVRGAVEWLVASLAAGTDATQVALHVAPRLLEQGNMALALSRSPRFASFREYSPIIETIENADSWSAMALVVTGAQRWAVDVALEHEPPHRIRSFFPRPVAKDAVAWADVVDRSCAVVSPADSELSATVARSVHDRLIAEVHTRQMPGLAVGIAVDGRVVHREYLGLADIDRNRPVTADSVFALGSVTKVVTALGVLALVGEDRVGLNDPVSHHLPGPTLVPVTGSRRLPTVREVLLHHGGLPRDIASVRRALQDGVPVGDATDRVELTAEPGSRPAYSNLGYVLLAALIERVAGEPLAEFLTAHVLIPLGMDTARIAEPGCAAPTTVIGYRLAAGTLAAAPPYVSPPGSGGAVGTLSDALSLAMALAAGSHPLICRAAEITGPSPIAGTHFCPGFAIADEDLSSGRRLLRGAPTAWKEGASDGFTAEVTAAIGGDGRIAIAILANKTPPNSFGPLHGDLAAQL